MTQIQSLPYHQSMGTLRPLTSQPWQQVGNTGLSVMRPDQLRLNPPAMGSPALQSPLQLFGTRPASSAAVKLGSVSHLQGVQTLQYMAPQTLKKLGQTSPSAFFKALLPAAIESEKKYGVPAAVTLAQAALESGWARSPIGGYNIFGIKGRGPAGTVNVSTQEYLKGRYVTIKDNFARYNNFYEAVSAHGKLFHNGYYNKGIKGYAQDKNPLKFVDNIAKTYATDPNYARKIKAIMQTNGLIEMVQHTNMV